MRYEDDALKRELLYGDEFLTRFGSQLRRLRSDDAFMQLIRSIHERADSECPGLAEEKRFASGELYTARALRSFPALSAIADEVKADGKALSSALISVYCAMLIMGESAHRAATEAVGSDADASRADSRQTPKASFNEPDFRLKWPAEYRCEDGHYVRSKNEALVDNWLFNRCIAHAYEKALFDPQTGATYCSDFYLPDRNLFIEVWGMASGEYLARRKAKIAFYEANGYALLSVEGDDVKNLDDVLSRALGSRADLKPLCE